MTFAMLFFGGESCPGGLFMCLPRFKFPGQSCGLYSGESTGVRFGCMVAGAAGMFGTCNGRVTFL